MDMVGKDLPRGGSAYGVIGGLAGKAEEDSPEAREP
jgi:hypothetical protein